MSHEKVATLELEKVLDEPQHEWYGPCDGMGPYGECSVCTKRTREFECFFNFLGWWHWSLGVHFDPRHPHLDIHVPFGFLRVGWNLWSRTPLNTPRAFHFVRWSLMARHDIF